MFHRVMFDVAPAKDDLHREKEWASKRTYVSYRHRGINMSFQEKKQNASWNDKPGSWAYNLTFSERKKMVSYAFLFASMLKSAGCTFDLGQDRL